MAKMVTKWEDARGRVHASEEEADRADLRDAIINTMSEIGWRLSGAGTSMDEIRKVYAILKRHLEPEQPAKPFHEAAQKAILEAPIDEARAADALCALVTLPGKLPEDGAWLTAQVLASKPREVIAILQGIERPEPISAEQAGVKLGQILDEVASHAGIHEIGAYTAGDLLARRRAEVMAILERVR